MPGSEESRHRRRDLWEPLRKSLWETIESWSSRLLKSCLADDLP